MTCCLINRIHTDITGLWRIDLKYIQYNILRLAVHLQFKFKLNMLQCWSLVQLNKNVSTCWVKHQQRSWLQNLNKKKQNTKLETGH